MPKAADSQWDSKIRPIEWRDDVLYLIDQRELPDLLMHLRIETVRQCATAIKNMTVRGAPAIGIAAAFGFVLGNRAGDEEGIELLRQARPTAANLNWAIDHMERMRSKGRDLLVEAQSLLKKDIVQNFAMAEFGAVLLGFDQMVLTHCNAGALATAGGGTALGVIRQGWQQERIKRVYATETRPRFQGTKLTAWELAQDKIPVTVITDSSAAALMARDYVQWVIVGADRIAANGDVANKIGTLQLAIVARHYGAAVMVVAPTSTIDWTAKTGEDIPIEFRSEKEVSKRVWEGKKSELVGYRNQAFDVTPAYMVDWIVTERGSFRPDKLGEMNDKEDGTDRGSDRSVSPADGLGKGQE